MNGTLVEDGAAAVDREVLLSHLKPAERYVDKGAQQIGRLQELIALLNRGGSDITAAQDLLRQVEQTQERYVSHREWLLEELKDSTSNQRPGPLPGST